MDEDFEPVELSDGTRVVVRPQYQSGSAIIVEHRTVDAVMGQIELPYPNAGLGGGRVILSPSERLVVISMFSGQSEEAYELVQVSGRLQRIAGEPYQFGQGASYAFSSDEALLAMALPFTCSDWWLPWDDGDVESDDNGRLAFGFGQLRFHELETGKRFVADIRVSAAKNWSPERSHYDPDMHPRFLESGRFSFSMPWASFETDVPPPTTIVIPTDTQVMPVGGPTPA